MSAQNVMAHISRSFGHRLYEQKPADNEVKFAGDENKDKFYEPKHNQKLFRVLTVIAYVFFVSLAAIILSLYYTYIWNPSANPYVRHQHLKSDKCPCNNMNSNPHYFLAPINGSARTAGEFNNDHNGKL